VMKDGPAFNLLCAVLELVSVTLSKVFEFVS
jgi:hypothetical protein